METHNSSMGSIWPMDGRFRLTTCMARHGTSKDTEWSESFFFLHLLSEIQLSRKMPSTSLFSLSHDFLTALTLCFLRQSQSSGWMGGFGSQSAQASAPQGPVMSNLGNYNMAGYQTQWAGCETRGIFLFLKIWSTALVQKGRGHIHKAFITDSCFSTKGLSLKLYFTQQHSFTLNF